MAKPEVSRRDENGDRIAVIHAYAPGDGNLSFVAKDPHTNIATSPAPTFGECSAACPDGWEVYNNGTDENPSYRARKIVTEKLLTETNTARVDAMVRQAAREQLGIPARCLSSFFEHGQWWVENLDTGAQWSVCDATPGQFCFEQVTEGDG